MRQQQYDFGRSHLLDETIKEWHKENTSLDPKIISRLRERLLKASYGKAANSLEPELLCIITEADTLEGLRFHARWDIKSFNTPLARRMINNVIRRHGLWHKEFRPDIEIVQILSMETRDGFYRQYYCLPSEVNELHARSLAWVDELKETLIHNIHFSLRNSKTYNPAHPPK